MSHELMITSAPRGLLPGSMGFCTVAMTPQMPSALQQRLETLSGYRHLFSQADSKSKLNPVCYQHLRLQVAGKKYSVLSRICDAGLDYTERTNKFGHHLVLLPEERPNCGPAELMLQQSLFTTSWQGEPRELPKGRSYSAPERQQGVAIHWKSTTGDAGWAGILAEMTMKDSSDPIYLEYIPGTDLLPLLAEALFYLPKAERWNVTYSTYYQGLPPDVTCLWRGVVSGSPEWKQARSRQSRMISVLPSSKAPEGGTLSAWARTGIQPRDVTAFAETDPEDKPYPLDQGLNKPQISLGSKEPFELSRKSTSPSKPTTSESRILRAWYSLPSILLGLLCGMILSAFLSIALWFAFPSDPSLEVAAKPQTALENKIRELEAERDIAKKNETEANTKVSKLQARIDDDKNKYSNDLRDMNDKINNFINKLNDEKIKYDKLNNEYISLKDASEALKKKVVGSVPAANQAMNDKIHKAKYFDYSKTISKGGLETEVTVDGLTKPSLYTNATILNYKKHGDLEYRKNNNGFELYKVANAAIRQDIIYFKMQIKDNTPIACMYFDANDEAVKETLRELALNIVELASPSGEKIYLTGIQHVKETRPIAIDIDASKLDSYINIVPKPYESSHDVHILRNNPLARGMVVKLIKDLVADLGDNITCHYEANMKNNNYYNNTLKITLKGMSTEPSVVSLSFKSAYVSARNTNPKDGQLPQNIRDEADKSRPNIIVIDNITICYRMHGVDIPIWSCISNAVKSEVGKPARPPNPEKPESTEAKL